MVTLTLAMDKFEHCKSLWKHNNSLPTDTEYLKIINSKIQDVKKQYCLPVYNHDTIDEIPAVIFRNSNDGNKREIYILCFI